MTVHNNQDRKRKFLLMLPIVALPFCALLFYAAGGGQDADEKGTPAPTDALNSIIPSPEMSKELSLNKLSLYKKADRDTESVSQQLLQDRLKFDEAQFSITNKAGAVENPYSQSLGSTTGVSYHAPNSPEAKVEALNKKLSHLQQIISTADTEAASSIKEPPAMLSAGNPESQQELSELQAMMSQLSPQTSSSDPELAQMNGMLEKILDIQHPDRVKQRLDEGKVKDRPGVYPVLSEPPPSTREYFGARPTPGTDTLGRNHRGANVFYGANDEASLSKDHDQAAIRAVIHQSQTLVSGATVKLRLEDDVYVDGHLIPRGTFLFGTCALSGERLIIDIVSVRNGNTLYDVRLNAYDLDGNTGIRIPGSITRDASKQATDQAIQSVAMNSLDPGLGAQVAAAGIETAKTLLSKKVRLVKVLVKADYPLLLKASK